jgi:hypothetical protein
MIDIWAMWYRVLGRKRPASADEEEYAVAYEGHFSKYLQGSR